MSISIRILNFLRSPVTVLFGVFLGFFIGFWHEDVTGLIAPAGKMYLAFLNMCILPIIITSVISGLAKIIRAPEVASRFPIIITGFMVILFIPGIVGTMAALIGKPGKIMDEAELDIMGNLMANTTTAMSGESGGLMDMIVGIVPWNFFESLGKGETMSIVFACLFIGMGVGFGRRKAADDLVAIIDVVSDVFNLMFKWAVNFLPIGICCVIADQVNGFSPGIIGSMLTYILTAYLAIIVLLFVYILLMSMVADIPFLECIKTMKDPLLLAFTVDSSYIAIKPCLDSLNRIPGVDGKISSLVVPFSIVANRQGKILIFAFTSIFLAQIYSVELGVSQYVTVIIGSALAGMAAPGSGVLLAPMAAVVINSIDVPSALVFVIFTVNGPIVDRALSVLTVQGSCLMASLSAKHSNSFNQQVEND